MKKPKKLITTFIIICAMFSPFFQSSQIQGKKETNNANIRLFSTEAAISPKCVTHIEKYDCSNYTNSQKLSYKTNRLKRRKKAKTKTRLITTFVVTPSLFVLFMVLSKILAKKKANSENELSFTFEVDSQEAVCYVSGFRRQDFYQILEIPTSATLEKTIETTSVTLEKNGETTKNTHIVAGIAEKSFKDDTTLEEVVIPKCVTYIGTDAFSGCTNLKKVTYKGSKSDWDAMTIEDGNDALTSLEIVFQ